MAVAMRSAQKYHGPVISQVRKIVPQQHHIQHIHMGSGALYAAGQASRQPPASGASRMKHVMRTAQRYCLSGSEARRATSGASGCRGGLQRELRLRPLSPCLVPSCRSPVHVFAYSCAPPPTAVPAPVHLQSLAAIASEERIRQVQKRLIIKEKSHQVSYLALPLSEPIVVLHRSQNLL